MPIRGRINNQRAGSSKCDLQNELAVNGSVSPTLLPDGSLCFPSAGSSGAAQQRATRTTKQLLQDVSTEVVVAHMFQDPKTLYDYVGNFVACYDYALDKANIPPDHACLVYKGGNILVDYFHQLLGVEMQYDGGASQRAFAALTKRSDTDFTVVIPAAIEQQNPGLRSQVNAAILEALSQFRIFLGVSNLLFPLPTQTEYARQASAYQAILDSDANGCKYRVKEFSTDFRSDLLITRDPRYTNCEVIVKSGSLGTSSSTLIPNSNQPTYVSFNDTLMFQLSKGVGHFDLARLKASVVMTVSEKGVATTSKCLSVPAELIDVSISHLDDSKRLSDINVQNWTTVVEYFVNGSRVPVLVPTLDYLVRHDLDTILFEDSEYPWDDIKYAKRLMRFVVGSCLLELFEGKPPPPRANTANTTKLNDANKKNGQRVYKLLLNTVPEIGQWMGLSFTAPVQSQFFGNGAFAHMMSRLFDVTSKCARTKDATLLVKCLEMFQELNTIFGNLRMLFHVRFMDQLDRS